MRIHDPIVALALLLAGSLVTGALAKEEKVPLDQVPAEVTKAEKAKWPKAEILGIEREEEEGKTIFEFALKEGARKWDASFDSEGAVIAVEETIAVKDVPQPVKVALAKKHPKANVLLVEKVVEGQGKSAKTFFEYKVKTSDGGLELKFDSDGKLVGEEVKKGDEINE